MRLGEPEIQGQPGLCTPPKQELKGQVIVFWRGLVCLYLAIAARPSGCVPAAAMFRNKSWFLKVSGTK